ncbi:hypothetical protein [Shewanella aestuarii]|uniref:Uncharacterized protein n=1 Tax=Shewanella aestuarii TaxID=1028752 RepID=A0A6G9QNE6_9GAMM|nr:hypothetical protein [Shewanella aestuarii]QIR15585.1 hypothetical protein HBH39_14735 [Shewanella aestuarii]
MLWHQKVITKNDIIIDDLLQLRHQVPQRNKNWQETDLQGDASNNIAI